jgi:membrane-associated phospholipid phosphatase
MVPNLASDQKKIWTSPSQLSKKKYLIPVIAVLGATAALIALDPHAAPSFRNSDDLRGFNNAFSGNNTAYGTIAVPAVMYATSFALRDSKMRNTALLAAEAVAGSEMLATVLKDATNRTRPAGVPVNGNYSDTWFESGNALNSRGGFPSGHTIAAFSVATVVARRYRNHRWVPYVAYGLAGAVAFSRVSLSAHFVSDVFVGGALGYSISRFVVLRE